MLRPDGAPGSTLNVSVCAGRSPSVALAVKLSKLPSLTAWSLMKANDGATFTSLTVTVRVSKSLSAGEPLSVTRTVIEKTPGPWDSVGVQVKTPLLELIAAPDGAPGSSEKVRAWPESGSA